MSRNSFYLLLGLLFLLQWSPPVVATEGHDVSDLSLDALLNVTISAAAKYAQTTSEAPASVTLIASEEIERYGYKTIAEALRAQPGFYLSNDRNYTYIGTRGFSRPTDYNNRVLLLINGHVTNENIFGSTAFGTDLAFDIRSVERIEVVRGPGSALYGTGALFAVVNVVLRSGAAIDGSEITLQVGADKEREFSLRFGRKFAQGAEFMISALVRRSDGRDLFFPEYEINGGVAEDLDWEDSHGLLFSASVGNFSIMSRYFWRGKGIPTGAFGIEFNNPEAESLDKQLDFDVGYTHTIDVDSGIDVRGYYNAYGNRGTYPYEENYMESSNGRWSGFEARFHKDFSPNHQFTAGFEYQYHWTANYFTWGPTESYFQGNFPYHIWSVYVQDEFQITQNLGLVTGLRHDNHSNFEGSTSPRLALIYHPTQQTTFKALYGRAYRTPNIYETFYEDADFQKANPDLWPETIHTWEVVLEHRFSETHFVTCSLYRYEMRDLINPEIDPADDMLIYRNLSEVQTTGFEVEVSRQFVSGPNGSVSYSWQDATDGKSGERLSNSPEHMFKLRLSSQIGRRATVAAEIFYESGRRTVQDTETDGFAFARLHFVLHPAKNRAQDDPPWIEDWDLAITIDNIFDQTFGTPGGFEHVQDVIAQDGRRVSLRLQCQF